MDGNNEIYIRQSTLHLNIPNVISIVGCGGTGFWVALFAAMSGVEHVILFDPDTIEESNLNRLPVESSSVGLLKVEVLSDKIRNIRPLCRVEAHPEKIETKEDCEMLSGTVFCCTDTLKSQQLLQAYCSVNHMKYQRAGYDGIALNVSDAFPLSFEDSPDGYRVIPSWAVPAAVSAAGACYSQFYSKLQWMGSMSDLSDKNISVFNQSHIDKIEDRLKDDGYGYCDDCDHDGYGYCDDCDRVSVDDGYGYCDDCDRYSVEDYQDLEATLSDTKDDLQAANDENQDLLDTIEELRAEITKLTDDAKTNQ